ncbi:trans-sulfuration enzyme family protein [Gemmatimonas sp.]|uniref:trans-sulfuration enzyme family protein n=1 Tax=Gemmatimonas sp. TaxID=1962908 RepID=UPI00398392AC
MSDIDAMPPMPLDGLPVGAADGLPSGAPRARAEGLADSSVARQLAQLDRTESALVLASGMAAVACTMVSLLRPGDHLLASRWLRPETRRFFEHELPALGVQVSFVDPTETRGWRRALSRTTRLVYLESPVDPTTRVVDMRPVRTLAQELGIALVVDATLASPINFRPVEHGADVVLHAASVFLDGHGHGFAGVVCGSEAVVDEVRVKMRSWGAEPHPAAVAQLARGLKTLGVRVAKQNATAMAVAQWVASQSTPDGAVRAVSYPGLAAHQDHVVATECLSGYGNLIALALRGGEIAVGELLGRLQHFRVRDAESAARLGGVESVASAFADGSVRLNIGLDDAPVLIGDLTQALE